LNGFLNIYKTQGQSSYDVIRQLKKYVNRKTRLGHLGTLDPMATGVLPVAVGQATRIIPYLDDSIKEYVASMTTGAESDTQDAWGQLVFTGEHKVDKDQLQDIVKEFTGRIRQIPPMYSAIHHEGKRLYELARQGIVVERAEREIEIHELKILEVIPGEYSCRIHLQVTCSKGTYIRTLCHDIGRKLGTGAYMSALERIRVGDFHLHNSFKIDELKDQVSLKDMLLPLDYPLTALPEVVIDSPESLHYLSHGNPFTIEQNLLPGKIKLYSVSGQLLAIAKTKPQENITVIQPERMFIFDN